MTLVLDFHAAWDKLPIGRLTDIIGAGHCVVLAPHPDDESLGCGGLIAACVADGRPPSVVILTDGTGSHPGSAAYPAERLGALRRREAITAVGALGLSADRIHFLDQKDTAAPRAGPAFDAIVETILQVTLPASTTSILAPWRHDPHCDHEAAALLAERVATRRNIRLVSFPVWGWTLPKSMKIDEPLSTGWRLDVSHYLPEKRRAIGAHVSQYGGLITDDPTGFQLPPAFLSVFDRPFEVFLSP